MKLEEAQSIISGIALLKDRGERGTLALLARAGDGIAHPASWAALGRWLYPFSDAYMTAAAAVISGFVKGGCKTGARSLSAALAATEPSGARVNRLLSCTTTEDLAIVLRPVLSYVRSKTDVPVDYVRLLADTANYDIASADIRERWARDAAAALRAKEKGESK